MQYLDYNVTPLPDIEYPGGFGFYKKVFINRIWGILLEGSWNEVRYGDVLIAITGRVPNVTYRKCERDCHI